MRSAPVQNRTRRRLLVSAAALAALAAAGALLLVQWVEPPARDVPVAQRTPPRELAVKLDQIDALDARPDVLVLGASTVMKYDPGDAAELFGGTAYNAGVSSATPRLVHALAAHTADRFDGSVPQLVIGANLFFFTQGAGVDGYLLDDARLGRYGRVAGLGNRLRQWRPHLHPRRVPSTVRTLWRRRSAQPVEAPVGGASIIGPRGSLTRVYDTSPTAIDRQLHRGVRKYRTALRQWREQGERLDEGQVEAFTRLLERAERSGVRPVVVLVPMNPAAREQLAGPLYDAQWRAVTDELARLQRRFDFEIVDVRDPTTASIAQYEFYDSVHVSQEAGRKVLQLAASAVEDAPDD